MRAAQRAHLTTTAAGEIARSANARRVEPFHFSPRYRGQEEQMMEEVRRAFDQEQEPAKAGSRSEERRVGKECVRSVELGGRRLIKKKKTYQQDICNERQ